MEVGLGIVVIILCFVVLLVWKGFRIVSQAEVVVIERLGKFHRVLSSGPNIILPVLDRARNILWRFMQEDPRGGANIYLTRSTNRIDLREIVYDFPRQNVITKDNVTLEINALLYFQITDPVKSVYEIQNVPDAIEKLTQTTLRNVIGELDLDDTLTSRDTINSRLRGILDEATDKWGVRVNRVELQDIIPPPQIREDMEKQMRAERNRRAQILGAEGNKRSLVLNAEGERESSIAQAEGHRTATILRAEGAAKAKALFAEAEAEAITSVVNAVGSSANSVQYLIAVRYIETLERIAQSPQKTVFLPYETAGVMGALGGLKELWNAKATAPTGRPVSASSPNCPD